MKAYGLVVVIRSRRDPLPPDRHRGAREKIRRLFGRRRKELEAFPPPLDVAALCATSAGRTGAVLLSTALYVATSLALGKGFDVARGVRRRGPFG